MVAFAKDYAPDEVRQRGDGAPFMACPQGGCDRVPFGRAQPQIEAPDAENRVGDFFSTTPETRRSDRRSARFPRREKADTFTKTASGVHYYGFRFYSPGQGRFLNRDPINEIGARNLALHSLPIFLWTEKNRYAFVWNDPVNFLDYLGLLGFGAWPVHGLPGGGPDRNVLDGSIGGFWPFPRPSTQQPPPRDPYQGRPPVGNPGFPPGMAGYPAVPNPDADLGPARDILDGGIKGAIGGGAAGIVTGGIIGGPGGAAGVGVIGATGGAVGGVAVAMYGIIINEFFPDDEGDNDDCKK